MSTSSAGATGWIVSIVWAPLAVLVAHAAAAAAFGHRLELDPAFHFLGGMAGAHALRRFSRRFEGATVVLAMLGVALLWELTEFSSDRLLGSHIQLGWLDTGSDVILGVVGAAVSAWVERHAGPD